MVIAERRMLESGTKVISVFDAFQAGVARKDIPKTTGLSSKQVQNALSHLREDGYLPQPTREEVNRNIKIALLGKPKSEEQLKKTSFVWEKIAPLALRGLLPWEITDIAKPSINAKQVKNALYRRGKKVLADKYPDSQKVRERQLEGIKKYQENLLLSKSGARMQENNGVIFARKLWEVGLIAQDTSIWQELNRLYSAYQKPLPKDNFDKLRLEVFLAAIKKLEYEDEPKLLTLYNRLGHEVGLEWFKTSLSRDESFIARTKKAIITDSPGFSGFMYSDDDDPKKRKMIREIVAQRKYAENYA